MGEKLDCMHWYVRATDLVLHLFLKYDIASLKGYNRLANALRKP